MLIAKKKKKKGFTGVRLVPMRRKTEMLQRGQVFAEVLTSHPHLVIYSFIYFLPCLLFCLLFFCFFLYRPQVVLREDSPCQSRGDTQQTAEGRGFPHQRERECARRLLSLSQVSIGAAKPPRGGWKP